MDFHIAGDFNLHLHTHFHGMADAQFAELQQQGASIMATAKELLELVKQVGPAINKLEADVTAALAKLPTVPPDVQADIDAAFNTLKTDLADAADGIDEANLPAPTPDTGTGNGGSGTGDGSGNGDGTTGGTGDGTTEDRTGL